MSGKNKRKRNKSKLEDEQEKTDIKLKSFRMTDFLDDKLDDFDKIMNRHLRIATYNVELARFVYVFKNMGKKLAKAVSTQNEIISSYALQGKIYVISTSWQLWTQEKFMWASEQNN